MFDRIKYCLKCFYMSGKSLPIFHGETKRKHKRKLFQLEILIALVAAVAIGVWAYFGIVERLNKLETSDTLFQADLLKKAEQEPKNLRNVYAYRTSCRSN